MRGLRAPGSSGAEKRPNVRGIEKGKHQQQGGQEEDGRRRVGSGEMNARATPLMAHSTSIEALVEASGGGCALLPEDGTDGRSSTAMLPSIIPPGDIGGTASSGPPPVAIVVVAGVPAALKAAKDSMAITSRLRMPATKKQV